MNARQKAKRYKKLYENMLKRPCPVIYEARDTKHYRASCKVNRMEIADMLPHALQNSIENRILEELRPIIWNNLKVKKDLWSNECMYSLDIWM